MAQIFSFDQMLIFGFMSVFLLIGFILRAKISFFQKFFIPACITAGILGLVLKGIGILHIPDEDLKYFAYHLFNITFISLGLTARNHGHKAQSDDGTDKNFKGVLSMGLLIASVAALQFLIGGGCVILFNLLGYNLFSTFGFLVPMGFEEGPGQALSIGQTWETYGFMDASTIGLSFAMFGFIVAIFVGVPLVGWAIKKGYTVVKHEDVSIDFRTGVFKRHQEKEPAGSLTTHSSAIDTLTVHFALIGVVYLITYGFLTLIEQVTPSDISEMYWGFFFIWGLLFAFILRKIIEKLGVDYVLDSRIQNRITGWSVDFLIVTSIIAITLSVVWKFIIPLVFMGALTAVITLFWVLYLGKRIWRNYNYERIAGAFGMETGTVATGLVLIRLTDPYFKTPAATDLAVSSIIALPFLFVMFHVMNGPILFGWSLEMTLLIFFIFEIAILALFKVLKLWHPPQIKK